MKPTTRILIAFILNLAFSLFEIIGGILTGSVAIASDALHAFGDSLSTGIAYFLERKSDKKNNRRYSILGAIIMSAILLSGSLTIIHSGIERLFEPTEVNYDGVMIFAIVGIIFSLTATLITHDHHAHHHHAKDTRHRNFNQHTVCLHMFQDALSWAIVLIGSVIMRFTSIQILDPLLSIGVAIFIIAGTLRNLNDILKSISVV